MKSHIPKSSRICNIQFHFIACCILLIYLWTGQASLLLSISFQKMSFGRSVHYTLRKLVPVICDSQTKEVFSDIPSRSAPHYIHTVTSQSITKMGLYILTFQLVVIDTITKKSRMTLKTILKISCSTVSHHVHLGISSLKS